MFSKELLPINPPMGVFPNYVSQVPVTLVLKESVFSLSGDDFTVNDTTGKVIVRCKGHVASTRDAKVIEDPSGLPLFTLKNKLLSIHKKFVAEDTAGKDLFTVTKNKLSLRGKLTAEFHNATDGQKHKLTVQGEYVQRGASIVTEDDRAVAHISRQLLSARDVADDKQTYYVTVAPGMDLALIAALCICFDEVKEQDD